MVKIRTALLSVSDKDGIVEFARFLSQEWQVDLISTGGTAETLRQAGLNVTSLEAYTGTPEMMDGRVKTLTPRIHGGILARRDNPQHLADMQIHGITSIDMVVANLYPFEKILTQGSDPEQQIENIDIGGPAMIRGAAKNSRFVTVVTDPAQYESIMAQMRADNGCISEQMRLDCAQRAFALTAYYDSMVAGWFSQQAEFSPVQQSFFSMGGRLQQPLRYGENPHQQAAFYIQPAGGGYFGMAAVRQLQGKELSYNNILDTQSALSLLYDLQPKELTKAGCVIVKHNNPCGVSVANTPLEAWQKALCCDPVSAFGGIIAFDKPLTAEIVQSVNELFIEVIIAPDITSEAEKLLRKKKNVRVLLWQPERWRPAVSMPVVRSLTGGFLVQSPDNHIFNEQDMRIVTKRAPTEQEMHDLRFAFTIAKHVQSNAIIYAKQGATVGIGAGQMSRIDSCRIAVEKSVIAAQKAGLSEALTVGSVVASDAFFPFADGLLEAAKAGVSAVIQPGGSIRDEEVIQAADDHDLAMIFTGCRHFRH